MNSKAKFLHVFLILALVLSSISPACHFISGKTIFEICAGDGGYQDAQVPDALLPFFASEFPSNDQEPPASTLINQPCAFCFSNAQLPSLQAQEHDFSVSNMVHESPHDAGEKAYHGSCAKPYHSRGPPASFA